MPSYEDRMTNIKDYLRESIQTAQPGFRYKSQVYEAWKRLGFTEDPAIAQHALYSTYQKPPDCHRHYRRSEANRPESARKIRKSSEIEQKQIVLFQIIRRRPSGKFYSGLK